MSRVADSSAPKVPWKRPEGCWHDFLVLIGWRKGLPRRRPVLTSHAQVCASPDGLAKVREALVFGCPSEVFRWEKALRFCNSVVEPTEALPDPVRIAIDLDNLKAVTRFLYHNTASVNSDGVALMREHLPQFYDKHSVDRAKRVSQFERDSKGITDECFAYGEIEPEVFATIYSKVAQAFGSWPAKANFYDLGCGVGNLVFAAAFIGDFNKVAGIEAIQALIDRGEKRMPRWERARPLLTKKMQKVRFMWQQDDFLKSPQSWADGTFLFLHWTAFNRDQVAAMGRLLNQLREGSIVVSLTNPVPNVDYEILVKDVCGTSWGQADFYVQEKLTPRKAIPGMENIVYEEEEQEEGEGEGEGEGAEGTGAGGGDVEQGKARVKKPALSVPMEEGW